MKEVEKLSINEVMNEINRLHKIKQERSLTDEENQYRESLKKVYIANYKQNLTQQLESIRIVDENGNISKVKKGNKNDK